MRECVENENIEEKCLPFTHKKIKVGNLLKFSYFVKKNPIPEILTNFENLNASLFEVGI